MTKIYDISRTLNPSIATWPDDHRFERSETQKITEGASVNLSHISMSIHTGTHVDAPYHVLDHGESVDLLDLSPFWGPAQVVTVDAGLGSIGVDNFSHVDLSLGPRILVRTKVGDLPDSVFPEAVAYPSLELVAHFAEHGIILFGVDAASVDPLDSKMMEVHKALYANQIHILEGIDLKQVPDGVYELSAMPLKIEGADGSPVRAVLRSIDG
jgi:arylformamidase